MSPHTKGSFLPIWTQVLTSCFPARLRPSCSFSLLRKRPLSPWWLPCLAIRASTSSTQVSAELLEKHGCFSVTSVVGGRDQRRSQRSGWAGWPGQPERPFRLGLTCTGILKLKFGQYLSHVGYYLICCYNLLFIKHVNIPSLCCLKRGNTKIGSGPGFSYPERLDYKENGF